jgi:hypothetical protein
MDHFPSTAILCHNNLSPSSWETQTVPVLQYILKTNEKRIKMGRLGRIGKLHISNWRLQVGRAWLSGELVIG